MMSAQFSVTKLENGMFRILVQTEEVVLRSYDAGEVQVIEQLKAELKMLRPVRPR